MKKFIKKFFKWTGITLLVLIILLILVPILFKDQIKEMVIKEVNKSLTAELSLGDFDLTFLSTFPNMTVELTDAKLTGLKEFKGVTLADLKKVEAHVDFWSVIGGDQVEIDEVHIYDPTFDIRVLQDGMANYDIVKPDSLKTPEEIEEPSSFKLSLKEYSITNANIKYDDRASDMYAEIDSLNHTGTGDLTADVIDFETTTNMSKLSYTMEGISYLTEVKTDALVNLKMEFTEKTSKFTLQDNKIALNNLNFSIAGFYEMLEDHDNMNLKLNAEEATFKDFLSLIPAFYQSGYESMVAGGNLALKGEVKGKMDDTNLPGWDFGLLVKNGSVKYPDLPGKISNIGVDAGSKFAGGEDLNKMTVDVKKFHANLSKNMIDANLSMRQLMTDPYLQSRILAKMDLATLRDFMPMAEGESYSGKLDADVDIKGKMSDLEKSDFEKFTAKGILALMDMKYKSPDLPDEVNIKKMHFTFSPQNLSLDEMDAVMGKSDFAMNGKVDNYFGYLLRGDVLKGNFNLNSNNLDIESLVPASETTEGSASPEPVAESSSESEPVLVPGNIDFVMNTNVKHTRYSGVDVNNVSGTVKLKDEIAQLENLTMNTMGGTVGLRGSYNTQNHAKPKMDFGYTLKELDIHELATNFITVEKLAPITKYAHGKISSNLDMKSDLTSSFEPILASLTSVGDISSKLISIKGFKLLDKVEQTTNLKNISNQTLKDFKTKFKVKDGKVEVFPFDILLGKFKTNVSGYTTLDQKMDYLLKMDIPKEEIPKDMVRVVEEAMSKLGAVGQKLNITSLPDKIPINIKVLGDVKDPKITTDFKEAILKATGDFKDNLIQGIKDTAKDTITKIIKDVKEDVSAEIEKKKKEIMAAAQKEADKVKAEAKKAADAVRNEAKKQGDDLITAAGNNPVKKKLAEASAKKLKDEAEKKAQRIEQEGNEKADGIMRKAQEKADAVK